jgi:glutathione S-transferase
MKLYHAPGACSLAVHIALREAGQPFDLVKVDLAKHMLDDGRNYYDISPRGYVPMLEFDDGSRHTEAAALLAHIADQDDHFTLIGAPRSERRLQVTQWLAFVASELHKAFSPWLWHKETADSTKQAVREKLAARFAELDRHLASHEYLAGEFSVADAYAFTIVNWSNFLGLPLSDVPNLKRYLARVAARPQVQAALKAEGLAN